MDRDDAGGPGEDAAAAADQNDEKIIPSDERLGTLIFAAVLTLVGIFWIFAASDLPSRQQTAYLTQGFLPTVSAIMLTGLSALLFVVTWRTKSLPPEDLGREPLFEREAQIRGAAVFGVLLVYILILSHVHYLISTFLLMAAGLALAREPIRPRLFILAAIVSILFYAVFVWGLQLPLPGSKFA